MRDQQERSGSLFSDVSIEEQIPPTHPLRRIRRLADQAHAGIHGTVAMFDDRQGSPSMPAEQLLLEQLHNNLVNRWIVSLRPDDPIWHPITDSLLPSSSTPKTANGSSTKT